jgi:putative protease
VYFGLDRFNARMRADNFKLLDLPALMAFLHERGVKGYLAFNTLVFADEMRDAAAFLREAIVAGIECQTNGTKRIMRYLKMHKTRQECIDNARE